MYLFKRRQNIQELLGMGQMRRSRALIVSLLLIMKYIRIRMETLDNSVLLCCPKMLVLRSSHGGRDAGKCFAIQQHSAYFACPNAGPLIYNAQRIKVFF